jgi:hypothetical protein
VSVLYVRCAGGILRLYKMSIYRQEDAQDSLIFCDDFIFLYILVSVTLE